MFDHSDICRQLQHGDITLYKAINILKEESEEHFEKISNVEQQKSKPSWKIQK